MTGSAAWADALQIVALFAADPAGLGGICVRAGAGPVRDRFLGLLRDAMAADTPLRRVPLNTGDDRLLGGLDLAATIQAGRPIMRRGLLAEADGGIVVLPMAERIESEAVARLRATMDAGTVSLQRDGLSHVLPARFGIVALDEGAQPGERPQAALLDRLAFLLDLTGVSLHDASPLVYTADRAVTPKPVADPVDTLCHAALSLGIDSPHPVFLALRAARTAARLAGRAWIAEADLVVAARLVLAPRATRLPAEDNADSHNAESQSEPPPDPEEPEDEPPLADKPLDDVVLDAARSVLPADLLAQLSQMGGGHSRGPIRAPGRAGQAKISVRRGRPIGTRAGEPRDGARLHLLETLKAAAPWQRLRGAEGRFKVCREDFRIVRFRQRIGTTTIFAVDASGSAALNRLAEAKGAVEFLLADCYVRRDQVALIAFRGDAAALLLPPTGSLLRAKRSLAGLPGGGPTPLAAGIDAATALAVAVRRSGRTPVVTVLTDARANIARDGTAGRPHAEADAIASAVALRAAGVNALLIDTSPRPNPFACRLATAMQARYLPLPYADASSLSRAVRAATPP